MRIRFVSFVLAVLTSWMILGTPETKAQTIVSKYGKDSIQSVAHLALYREFYKQKNYKAAIPSWRYVFNNCPRATENIFINGANMFNSFIAAEKDSLKKSKLIDTLLLIYDTRIKYYGNEGKHLAGKANDLLNADTTKSLKAYGMLKSSIDLLKNSSEESTLINYCRSAIVSFKAGKISSDAMIGVYNQTTSIIDNYLNAPAAKADSPKWVQFSKLVDQNILPLLQCKDISILFTPRLAAKPDDLALLKKISELLFHNGCTEDSLYLSTLEKMNRLEPDVNTTFLIARVYLKQKNLSKAVDVLTNVANNLKDAASKARCYYYLGVVYADAKDYTNARSNALKAIVLFKPDYGEPYLLIAECYAQSAMECGSDNMSQRAVFWCAVDKLKQALKVAPKLEPTVSKLIKQYSINFPTREMLNAGKLKIGTKFVVGCWINETTTVRLNTETI